MIHSNIKYTGVYPNQAEYSRITKLYGIDGVKTVDAVGKEFVSALDMLGRTTQSATPVNGTWSYGFDANDNLISQTDAKNQTISLEYDELNRLTKKNYPDGSRVNLYYDETGHGSANGRLTRIEYPGGAESYTYDARGRKTAQTQTIGGISKTKNFTYNALDQVVTQTLPDGEVVTNTYDAGGMLSGLTGAAAYLTDINYYASAKISNMVYGNGVRTDYDYYDTAGETDASAGVSYSYRLRQIRVYKSGDLLNLNYEYDKSDNVKVKRDALNANYTETYGYDDLSRLINASSASYGNKTFQYDTINNIRQKDGHTYQYDTINPYKLVNDGRYSYTYDANGSMIGRSDGRVIGWDYENRVTTIANGSTTEGYVYDDEFRRLKKVNGNISTYYFFNDYEEEYTSGVKTNTIKYYFANNQRIAEKSTVDGVRYYHQDHLSSSTAVTNASGVLVLRNNYAPYGEDALSQGSASVRYKFTDKEKDQSGLYFLGARYYDPEMGRFISVDPAEDGDNWYAYCNNNPIVYIDPDGMISSSWDSDYDWGETYSYDWGSLSTSFDWGGSGSVVHDWGNSSNIRDSIYGNSDSWSQSSDDSSWSQSIPSSTIFGPSTGLSYPIPIYGPITGPVFRSVGTEVERFGGMIGSGPHPACKVIGEIIIGIGAAIIVHEGIKEAKKQGVNKQKGKAKGDCGNVGKLKPLPDSKIKDLGGEAYTAPTKQHSGKSKSDLYWNPKTGDVYSIPKNGGPPQYVDTVSTGVR